MHNVPAYVNPPRNQVSYKVEFKFDITIQKDSIFQDDAEEDESILHQD